MRVSEANGLRDTTRCVVIKLELKVRFANILIGALADSLKLGTAATRSASKFTYGIQQHYCDVRSTGAKPRAVLIKLIFYYNLHLYNKNVTVCCN